MTSTLRILDAAANRAREALRVLEDAVRFSWDDQATTAQLKALRDDLAAPLALLPMSHALQERDTPNDVGTTIKTDAEFSRTTLHDILAANAKRLTEALRSLEEFAKLESVPAAAQLEQLRYRAYALEQSLLTAALAADATQRFRHVRLYILLTESLCLRPWESTLDEILASQGVWHRRPADAFGGGTVETSPADLSAEETLSRTLRASDVSTRSSVPRSHIGGTPMPRLCIQLREKSLPDGELLRRARLITEKCHAAGALAIINDRPDIALLANADGVHVGQTDLPVADCRKILGPEAIVGISTENLDQARAAEHAGATYIAVGPMFPTTTKEKPRIAGPEYAGAAAREIRKPLVAIGGITPQNAHLITQSGVRCLAVSCAILRAPDPAKIISEFLNPPGNQ